MLITRVCFWLLVICAAIYILQLGIVLVLANVTEPPVCKIVMAAYSPAPLCPGADWSQHTRHLMSLPGAIVTYPLEIAAWAGSPAEFLRPMFLAIMALHAAAWVYMTTKIVQLAAR